VNTEREDSPTTDTGVQEKRRQLLKGGLAILMTVVSRSAMACHSTTPSAFGSIALTGSRPDRLVPLSGRSPGYWQQWMHFGAWPSPYYPTTTYGAGGHKATLFTDCFQGSLTTDFSGKTLLDVLGMQGGDEIALARAITAALLNAASGRTSAVLGVQAVRNIWTEYVNNKGYFEPTAGIKWYIDTPLFTLNGTDTGGDGGIIGYLNSTWS
jgi:hypothetical protein